MGRLEYLGNLRVLLDFFCFSSKNNIVAAYYETLNVKIGNYFCEKLKNCPKFGKMGYSFEPLPDLN